MAHFIIEQPQLAAVPTYQAALTDRFGEAKSEWNEDIAKAVDDVVAGGSWLPAVALKSDLPDPSLLDPNKNYLCRVQGDPEPDNNGTWQLVAHDTQWLLYERDQDFVDTPELQAAIASHNDDAGSHSTILAAKVDKVSGKSLSSNDFTDADVEKLGNIEEGAQVNTVTSVANKTGAVSLDSSDVGLGNVNNTTDANKPISSATQDALDTKLDKIVGTLPLDVVYRHKADGTESNLAVDANTGISTLAKRTATGQLQAVAGTQGVELVTFDQLSAVKDLIYGGMYNDYVIDTPNNCFCFDWPQAGSSPTSPGEVRYFNYYLHIRKTVDTNATQEQEIEIYGRVRCYELNVYNYAIYHTDPVFHVIRNTFPGNDLTTPTTFRLELSHQGSRQRFLVNLGGALTTNTRTIIRHSFSSVGSQQFKYWPPENIYNATNWDQWPSTAFGSVADWSAMPTDYNSPIMQPTKTEWSATDYSDVPDAGWAWGPVYQGAHPEGPLYRYYGKVVPWSGAKYSGLITPVLPNLRLDNVIAMDAIYAPDPTIINYTRDFFYSSISGLFLRCGQDSTDEGARVFSINNAAITGYGTNAFIHWSIDYTV